MAYNDSYTQPSPQRSNKHPENPKRLETNEARQGGSDKRVWRILVASTALTVLALAISAFIIS
jgi:anti-sigma-K factor RskA